MIVKLKKIHPDAQIPKYATPGSAAFDFHAVEDVKILPKTHLMIKTGITMEVPEGHVLQIWDRSGFGAKGLHRFAGVVDSDYREEIKVVIYNSTTQEYEIKKGDRIAQGIVIPCIQLKFEEANELNKTQRSGGFGSTGK